METFVNTLTEFTLSFLSSAGYVGLLFLITLETILPPFPSEIILPLTGFMVQQGILSFPLALLFSTLGSVIGAFLLYLASERLGQKRVMYLVKKYGKYLGLSVDDINRGFLWFQKHGPSMIGIGRLVPGIRSVISIPAGLSQMDRTLFLFYTTLGSLVWNTILIGFGWYLGKEWHLIGRYMKYIEYFVGVSLVGLLIRFMIRKRMSSRR